MKTIENISVSDNGFLFNSNTGETFKLNPIAVDILNYLKNEHSFDELVDYVYNKYEVDKLTLDQHLTEFLSLLRQYQLIED